MPSNLTPEDPIGTQTGLDFWMAAVIRQCDEIRRNFNPTAVHDLRVALRRCRSIADGFMALDPHPAWKQMKIENKRLFQQLGALRDTQVMREWAQRFAPTPDTTALALKHHLDVEETRHRENAAAAVLAFNKKKWADWSCLLFERTRLIPIEEAVFQHLALERLSSLQALHRQAMRNRSQASFHRVRLALKKFRYMVDNFLPALHEQWGQELREIQDLLGEMHDICVLWHTALAIKALPTEEARKQWHQGMANETGERLARYRAKMAGKASLLSVWRAALPQEDSLNNAALSRFQKWASFRDPDVLGSEQVANLALQIYDGMLSLGLTHEAAEDRRTLQMAALSRTVGLQETHKKYQAVSYRMIRKINSLAGLENAVLNRVALLVRFHRGPLPRLDCKALSLSTDQEKASLILLSGILRLAHAFYRLHGIRISNLRLELSGDVLFIAAPGYSSWDVSAEKLAAARHLLETACGLPILIRGHA